MNAQYLFLHQQVSLRNAFPFGLINYGREFLNGRNSLFSYSLFYGTCKDLLHYLMRSFDKQANVSQGDEKSIEKIQGLLSK